MNNKHIVALVILALGILLAMILISSRDEPEQLERKPSAPAVTVTTVAVESGRITVTATGTVQAAEESELASQVAGRVVSVSPDLKAGSRVAEGDVIVQLDPADYRNAVHQARAEVAQAEVGVLQAEEESDLARREFERYRNLETGNSAGTGFSVPETVAATQDAEAGSNEPSALTLREPQRRAAQAALERARARAEDAELALDRTRLRAPFDSYVRSENVSVGDYVSPGRVIARLYASDTVEVLVPMTARQASRIPGLWQAGSGSGATIQAEVMMDYGDQRFSWPAEVARVQAELDAASRTLDVVLRVSRPFAGGQLQAGSAADSNDAPPLLVGTFVDVTLEGRALDAYLRVPRNAVRTGNEIWWVDSEARLHIAPVEVIQTLDNHTLVTGDFSSGEGYRVVISELDAVTEGMRVQPRGRMGNESAGPIQTEVSRPEIVVPETGADSTIP